MSFKHCMMFLRPVKWHVEHSSERYYAARYRWLFLCWGHYKKTRCGELKWLERWG